MRILVVILAAMMLSTTPARQCRRSRFTDITAASGIDFVHAHSPTSNKYLIETMGGGVALFDYDNDGRLDIFFTNGAHLDDPQPARQAPGQIRSAVSGTACIARTTAGPATAHSATSPRKPASRGCRRATTAWASRPATTITTAIQDLYVTNYEANTLYRNNRDGTFTDVTKQAGVAAGGWSASAGSSTTTTTAGSILFVDALRRLELPSRSLLRRKEARLSRLLSPRQLQRHRERPLSQQRRRLVHRRLAKGRHRQSEGRGLAASRLPTMTATGSCDRPRGERLRSRRSCHRNRQNGTFEEVGLLAGVAFTEDGKTFAGMGVDFADYDNDSRPDLIVTDLSNERYRLFRQNNDRSFRDVTDTSGIGGATLPFSGWSTRFFDYDNDGWKDLFAAQGHVMDTIEKTSPNLRYQQPPLLMRNESGRFVRVRPATSSNATTPPAARLFGDLDNDGDVDIVFYQRRSARRRIEKRRRQPTQLARHPHRRHPLQPRRHRLRASSSPNTSGLTQHFTITTAIGYLSASDKRLVAGLGADTAAKRWRSAGRPARCRRSRT